MGSDESYFSVSLTARDKVTGQRPWTKTFEVRRQPKGNRSDVLFTSLNAIPLSQTGSQSFGLHMSIGTLLAEGR